MVNSLSNISTVLDEILYPTYGQIIYQEQVTEICRKIAGYDEGKADLIRKLIGRKLKAEMDAIVPELTKAFMDYGKLNQEQADYLASAVQACSGYTFNHCLAGSERIQRINNMYPYTIESMYKVLSSKRFAKETHHLNLRDKYLMGKFGNSYSIDKNGKVVWNKIISINFAGIREVFKITTATGKVVRCTENHKFPTDSGIKETKDLKIGDSLFIVRKCKQKNYSYNIGIATNLPHKGQQGFQKKKIAVSSEYENFVEQCKNDKRSCDICGKKYEPGLRFEAHHKNMDRSDSSKENLSWLCVSCHKKAHYRIGRSHVGTAPREVVKDKIVSIVPDGVENTYSVEMDNPNHTFTLMNGIVSHNSHAVEYGLIAYQTAYLKANYPVEYMVALLNNNMDNQDKVVEYINECAKLGIEVFPPDVSVGNMTFVPTNDNKAIRIGISYIKGLHNISCEYKNGMSMKAFVMTNNIKPTDAEKLVKAGAFDVFKMSRGQMLIVAGEYIDKIRQIEDRLSDYANRIKIKQDTLKTTNPATKKYKQLVKQIDNANERIIKLNNEHDDTEKVLDDVANYDIAVGELETLGFTYQDRYKKYVTDGCDMYSERKVGEQYVLGEVIKVKKIKDKNKHDMAFVKVNTIDKKMIELVMFASSYQQLSEKVIYLFKINKGKFLERAMKPKEKV